MQTDSRPPIETLHDLVARLGGPAEAHRFFKVKTIQVVDGWLRRGQIPPRRYIADKELLAELGIVAPAHLWGFPKQEGAAPIPARGDQAGRSLETTGAAVTGEVAR